ncbi:MAG: protein kinase [Acidobacteriota bacterium]
MELVAGNRLGPYEIVSRIGAGGMGDVFRARDTRLDRTVAVKVLPPHLASDPQLRERFDREAQAISSLSHPHICTLFDVGSEDGIDYLVMELLEGETLADRLTRGALPLQEVYRYGTQLSDALAQAHNRGIVHRDLKPGNVMLTKSGVKLLDFGLARAATPGVVLGNAETEHRPLTAEGTILGTFQYMAPEQLEGTEADARTDIFALGAVLYEMATGQRAFDGKTKTSLIAAIVAGQPRRLVDFDLLAPEGLEHVIQRCLEKDPVDRWQSANDVARELEWIAERATAQPVSVRSTLSRPLTVALAAAALLAAVALGVIGGRSLLNTDPQPVLRSTIVPPKGVTIRPDDGEDAIAISPDGRLLAFTGTDGSGRRLVWVLPLDQLEARSLDGTDGARQPFWSKDGRSLAFFAKGKLKTVALDGSPPVTICSVASNPMRGDWGPDGTILYSPSSGAAIYRVASSGGTPAPATTLNAVAGETTHRWARFLPDGQSFLFMAGSHQAPESAEINAIYAARLDSNERKLVVRARSPIEYSSGYLFFVRKNTLLAQPFDARKLKVEGDPIPVATNVQYAAESFSSAFSVSGANRLVYTRSAPRKMWELDWLDRSGKTTVVAVEAGNYQSWTPSPDWKQLAITITDPDNGDDIWLRDLERNTMRRFTHDGKGSSPAWSPDSTRIAYEGGDSFRTLVRSVQNDDAPQPVWEPGHWGGPVSWSPDGRYLALWSFDQKSANNYDALLLPLFGERKTIAVAASPAAEFPDDFSPDGRWLLYESDESGQAEIFAVSVPDLRRRQQISTAGGSHAIWAGPREIWYRYPDGTFVSVTLTDSDDGKAALSPPRILFKDPGLVGVVSAPGGRLLGTRQVGEDEPTRIVVVEGWPQLLVAKAQ